MGEFLQPLQMTEMLIGLLNMCLTIKLGLTSLTARLKINK